MERHEKFILWCDKTMAFSFYALIYFLPISIALSETFTVLALVCFLLKRGAVFYGRLKELSSSGNRHCLWKKTICFLKSFKPISNSLNWPIVFLLCFSIISVLFSQYRSLSFNGFLGKTLQSAFIFFTFIECMNSRKRLKIFVSVFFVSYTLICINGFFQAITGHGFIHGHIFDGRITSSLRAANDLAAYLIVIVPVLFCLVFLTGSQKEGEGGKTDEFEYLTHYGVKIAHLILFLLGFITLGLTYSRGAWVGFIFSLLLMCLFGLRNRRIVISYSLLIVFFLAIFYPGSPLKKVSLWGTRPSPEISSPSETASSETDRNQEIYEEYLRQTVGDRFHIINLTTFLVQNNRLEYWRRSLRIIKDYPVFGCGLNTYALVAGRYNVGLGGYPHNSYLQMAAEIGLIGVLVFLWMLFVLFRDSIRALRQVKIQTNKILIFGFLTGLLGFLIHSFFDTNLYSVQLGSLFWVIMGVIVVFQKIEKA